MNLGNKLSLKLERRRVIAFAVCAFALLMTLPFYSFFQRGINFSNANFVDNSLQQLAVSFINVGQGDAAFVAMPNGETMLVDCGDDRVPTARKNLDKFLRNFFKERAKKKIDHVVATHNDRDHVGNMPFVFENYGAKNFYYTMDSVGYIDYALDTADCAPHLIMGGETIDVGGSAVNVRVLSASPVLNGEANDYSAVITIEYLGKSFCLAADATADIENYITPSIEIMGGCDVLKVAHHGSGESSTLNFLTAVDPKIAVISCGKNNQYGHPAGQMLARIAQLEEAPRVLRTDRHGTITLIVSQKSLADTMVGIGVSLQHPEGILHWWFIVLGGMFLLVVVVLKPKIEKTELKNTEQKGK